MRLKTFILLISALVTSLIMGLFYVQANSMLSGSFKEMETLHVKSVREYAASILQGRKYLLTTYGEEMNKNNHLSRLYVMAEDAVSRSKVLSELQNLRKKTQCDVADILSISKGRPVGDWGGELERNLLTRAVSGQSLVRVESRKDKVWLVTYFPLLLFRDVVGVGVLGYELNGRISKEISQATNAKVRFVPAGYQGEGKRAEIVLGAEHNNQAASLVIETNFVAALTSGTTGPILLSGLVSLLAIILVLYLVLTQGFVKGFGKVLAEIDLAASELDRNVIRVPEARTFPIKEVSTLSSAFAKFAESTKHFHERVQAKTRTEAMGEKAAQLAHDLKGPVEALSMALDLDDMSSVPENRREAIRSVLSRIRKISSAVKDQSPETGALPEKSASKKQHMISDEIASVEDLSVLVDSIVAEKSIQYGDLHKITLLVEPPADGGLVFVRVESGELQRVLSNLIDNAVQAIQATGSVTVRYSKDGDRVYLKVVDNGHGVPESVLAKVGERGFSYGKKGGSGLGLWHAKAVVKKWGGELEISSVEGQGTTVGIRFPACEAPSWKISELTIPSGSEIIVLDDDPSIHFLWDERFKVHKSHFNLVHFQSAEELVIWCVKRRKPGISLTFLCDYELSGQPWTGLQVIEELGLEGSAILCTGHSRDEEVRKTCSRLGIKLLAKDEIARIPIRVTKAQGQKKARTK